MLEKTDFDEQSGDRLDRRQLLERLGLGALSLPFVHACAQDRFSRRSSSGHGAMKAMSPEARELEALVELVRDTARAELFEAVLKRSRDAKVLLGAAFFAGVREVKPRPVGFKLHCVMMVPSALELARQSPAQARLLPVLFNLDDFKRSQAIDAREGDWSLPEAREAGIESLPDAREALARGLEDWDEEQAQAGAAALARLGAVEPAFELLWPAAMRDVSNLGHKVIFAAQAYRTLKEIGWWRAEQVMASLIHGLLDGGPGSGCASWERNAASIAALREDWALGTDEPDASALLLNELRTCSPDQAADGVINLLSTGVSPRSVWDGLRLAASEILINRPGILGVHPLTITNAFRCVSKHAGSDRLRRLCIVQAAAWIVQLRQAILRRQPDAGPERRIDEMAELPQAQGMTVGQIFEEAARSRTDGAGLLVTLAQGERRGEALEHLRGLLFRKGVEHHQYKYTAAVIEESRTAHPRWGPTILAAALYYLPTEHDDDSPVYLRARQALGA